MSVRLSIVVPVYNAAATLERCVRSILAQDFPEYELILCDDGSTDESAALCERLAAGDRRIRVLHKPNSGASGARNAGLDLACGDYLHFVDADDEIDPGLYSDLLPVMDRERLDAFLFACRAPGSSEPLDVLPDCFAENLRALPADFVQESILRTSVFSAPYNKIFRTASVRLFGLRFDESLSVNEDFRFNLQFFSRAVRLRFTPSPYYCYHSENAASLSRSFRTDLLDSARHNRDAVTAFAAAAGLDPEAAADRYEAACAVRQFYLLVGRSGDKTCRKDCLRQLIRDDLARTAILDALQRDPNRGPARALHALVRSRAVFLLAALLQAKHPG